MCRTTTTEATSVTATNESNTTASASTTTTTTTAANDVVSVNDYGSPDNWFIFIVGNCEEWPENRKEQGDIGLYNSFIEQGIPLDQICYVKNDQCTQHNCSIQLQEFLSNHNNQQKMIQRHSTFFFYYGGHGIPSGFCTLKNNNDDDSDDSDDDDDDWSRTWLYQDIVQSIDQHYMGDRVIFLLDCCASGNLHHWLEPWSRRQTTTTTTVADDGNKTEYSQKQIQPRQRQRPLQYVCLTCTPPYITATDEGDEWVVNHCWMQAMHFQGQDSPLKLSRYLEFFADRLALVMGDQAVFTYSPDVDLSSRDWMPRRMRRNKREQQHKRKKKKKSSSTSKPTAPTTTFDWPRLEKHIPDDARVDASHWGVGDCVYYKHKGGPVTVDVEPIVSEAQNSSITKTIDVPPCWLNATIVVSNADKKDMNGTPTTALIGQLRVFYQGMSWTVDNVRRDQLMNDLYMCHAWMLPDGIIEAQVRLARNYKYIDFSWPAYKMIHVVVPIDKVGVGATASTATAREATIVDWRDVDWEDCLDQKNGVCQKEPPFGAHVPIRWTSDNNDNQHRHQNQSSQSSSHPDNKSVVLLPVEYIVVQQQPSHSKSMNSSIEPVLSVVPKSKSERRRCSRRALIKSIESSGKKICYAGSSIVGNDEGGNDDVDKKNGDDDEDDKLLLSVFWPQDGEWYDATAMDVDTVPLKVLASHVQFTLSGGCRYCPVAYADDDSGGGGGEFDLTPLHYVRRKKQQHCSTTCRDVLRTWLHKCLF